MMIFFLIAASPLRATTKAAALISQSRHVIVWACQMTAERRLFFFCRRPADIDKTYISYDLLDCSFSSATHLIMCAFCSDENRMVFIARVYASASLLF